MILLTLGTHEQQFNRALDLIEPLARSEEVFVQHGCTAPRREKLRNARWAESLEFDDLLHLMRDASAVVSHSGVGSIVTALRMGHRPVAIPRLARYGEHVDDHQVQLAERFGASKLVVPCMPGDSLADAIAEARAERISVREAITLRRAVAAAARGELNGA